MQRLMTMRRKRSQGLTLIQFLIGLALAIVAVVAVYFLSGPLGGMVTQLLKDDSKGAARTQIIFVAPLDPVEFQKNTDAEFIVELQRFNALAEKYEGYAEQPALVGVVLPNTVSIVRINGEQPDNEEQLDPNPDIPGLSGGGTAYQVKTDSDGRITFVLHGTEPADGQVTVLYVRSTDEVQHVTKYFSVTE